MSAPWWVHAAIALGVAAIVVVIAWMIFMLTLLDTPSYLRETVCGDGVFQSYFEEKSLLDHTIHIGGSWLIYATPKYVTVRNQMTLDEWKEECYRDTETERETLK